MISIIDKKRCSGCGACYSVCPKKCINMESDEEGFLYPVVNRSECVDCQLCEKICPIINKKNKTEIQMLKQTYIVQNKNKDVLEESTSGGYFSALCNYVFINNGIVFGVAYDEQLGIRHTWIDEEKYLSMFRNSKYTQSQIGDSFIECKKLLEMGRLVCFSGTPCQIAGLKRYLKKDYDNLITIDVVCRGVPSPLLFKKYVEWLGGTKIVKTVKFRDKYYGYFCSTMSIYYKDGQIKRREIRADPMLNLFFENYCSRPSCHNCSFKTIDRDSDFTVFDCWHANKYHSGFGEKGATAVIIHNNRAKNIFRSIQDQFRISIECKLEDLLNNDGKMLIESVSANTKRKEFFSDLLVLSFEEVLRKYQNKSVILKVKLAVKNIAMRTGLFSKIMFFKYKYR